MASPERSLMSPRMTTRLASKAEAERWKEIARFLHELGQLKRVQRSGWWLAGVRQAESVAEHTFRTAAIAYILAELEGASADRAASLAVFHDTAETRVNDSHRLQRLYADWAGVEEKVSRDQLESLPSRLADKLAGLLAEAREEETLEARVARDADRLECLLQAREYAARGHGVEPFLRTSLAELTTRSARRLARAILGISPGSWHQKTLALKRPVAPRRRAKRSR